MPISHRRVCRVRKTLLEFHLLLRARQLPAKCLSSRPQSMGDVVVAGKDMVWGHCSPLMLCPAPLAISHGVHRCSSRLHNQLFHHQPCQAVPVEPCACSGGILKAFNSGWLQRDVAGSPRASAAVRAALVNVVTQPRCAAQRSPLQLKYILRPGKCLSKGAFWGTATLQGATFSVSITSLKAMQ